MKINRDPKALTRKAVILAAALLVPWACRAQEGRDIRVLILDDVPSVVISVAGPYRIRDSGKDLTLYAASDLKGRFTGSRSSVVFAGKSFKPRAIIISSDTGQPIGINNRKYKGSVQLARKDSGRLAVVNFLDLEDYVKGIAVRETSHYWPMEALKAEAVVFRTFALYRREQFKAKDFDVTADVFSQSYGGQAAERYRISDAVDQTKDEALFFGTTILPAFYHSTCAGRTEDASLLWAIDIPPLKGVTCGFCAESPHFSWKTVLSKDNIREAWNKKQPGLKKIREVLIAGRDDSGRVATLDIVTEDRDIEISAKDFRQLMGPDLIRSTNFKILARDPDVVFEGLGWGHGVGLCQWGAYFMAKKGASYKDILAYYYPSSTLQRIP